MFVLNNSQRDEPRILWKQLLFGMCPNSEKCWKKADLHNSVDFSLFLKFKKDENGPNQENSNSPDEQQISINSSQLYSIDQFSNISLNFDVYFDLNAHLFNVRTQTANFSLISSTFTMVPCSIAIFSLKNSFSSFFTCKLICKKRKSAEVENPRILKTRQVNLS